MNFMNNTERDVWLASLKVGDLVAYNVSNYGINWKVDKITKITATRRIKTKNGISFNKNGSYQIDDYSSYTMYPYDDEIKEEIEKKNLYNIVKGKLQKKLKVCSTYNIEDLKKLNDLLGDN